LNREPNRPCQYVSSLALDGTTRYRRCSPNFHEVIPGVFVFFSNRLGCGGSLLVSLVVTVVLVLVLRAVLS